MHSSQIRSACERCRKQKLRCSRLESETSCARCSRMGLQCQNGSQRRVGRPPKRDLVQRKPSASAGAVGPMANGDPFLFAETPFLDNLLNEQVIDLPWSSTDAGLFGLGACDAFTTSFTMPMVKELEPPRPNHQHALLADNHFESLSHLNVEIHKGWDSIFRLGPDAKFMTFACIETDQLCGFKNIQDLIRNIQQFLVLVKELHYQIGRRPLLPRAQHGMAQHMALSMQSPSPSSEMPTTEPRPTPPVYDSPIMFLVISCYVQLVKHLDFLLKMIHDFVADATQIIMPASDIAFSDMKIIHGPSQYIMFIELMKHVLGQINLVLGLPSPWSGRTAWTGLLKAQKYREMVNQELGSVEGPWTARPARLIQVMEITKELLVEYSMLGY